MLTAPISYQGGKQRIAVQILDRIDVLPSVPFHDLCCGCGAISIELVNRGHKPSDIHMLDAGPWGLFWADVGNGVFDLDRFKSYCYSVPADRKRIKPFMQAMFDEPADDDRVYEFLLLQACAFGGAAVWLDGDKWCKGGGFRDYWQPTATSNRRSPVNPMMPMPDTLFERVKAVVEDMKGVRAICADIRCYRPGPGIIYIDPPYEGTTSFGHTFDVLQYAHDLQRQGRSCYVSEGKALSARAWKITEGRAKGGMNGGRKSANEEWLSLT
jgi:hypothetical protein